MGEISLSVDVRAIRDSLQNEAEDYVKNIWYTRRLACLDAAGEVLNKNGYLPKGTTWEAVGNECQFYVERGGKDLTHYFHEGLQYGPNFFIKQLGEWRSPKGKPKRVVHPIYTQGIGSPAGVAHWTYAISEKGPLYAEYVDRCREILLR